MLRVALICPFNLERLSGTPVRAYLTAQALNNHSELLVCATGGKDAYVRVIEDVWEPRPQRQPRFRLDRFTTQVVQILHQFQPDVIHLMTPTGILSALSYQFLHPRTKIITELHGLTRYEMTGGSWLARHTFQWLDSLSLHYAHRIIAMSYSQKKIITQLFGEQLGSKISVIWGPVDLSRIQAMPLPVAAPWTIGYLGNGSFWQGIGLILTAIEQLKNQAQIHFVLGGVKPDEDKVKLPHPLPANLTVVPGVPAGAENLFLSQCHAFISSRIAGMVTDSQYPYKLSYYLAAGRPIIASDVSDQGLILTQANCGLMFNPDQPDTLAEAILTLFRTDEQKRQEMGKNGREFAENHLNLERLGGTLVELYQDEGWQKQVPPPSPTSN